MSFCFNQHPKLQAIFDQSFPTHHKPTPAIKQTSNANLKITLIAAAAFVAPFFIAFPLAMPIQIIAFSFLAKRAVGIINCTLAYRQCSQYFTVGHDVKPIKLTNSDNLIENGIAWSFYKESQTIWPEILLAVAARSTSLVALNALVLAPIVVIGLLGTCLYAHIKSIQTENFALKPENNKHLNELFQGPIPRIGYLPLPCLKYISNDKRAAYIAVVERNRHWHGKKNVAMIAIAIGSVAVRILLTIAA